MQNSQGDRRAAPSSAEGPRGREHRSKGHGRATKPSWSVQRSSSSKLRASSSRPKPTAHRWRNMPPRAGAEGSEQAGRQGVELGTGRLSHTATTSCLLVVGSGAIADLREQKERRPNVNLLRSAERRLREVRVYLQKAPSCFDTSKG